MRKDLAALVILLLSARSSTYPAGYLLLTVDSKKQCAPSLFVDAQRFLLPWHEGTLTAKISAHPVGLGSSSGVEGEVVYSPGV